MCISDFVIFFKAENTEWVLSEPEPVSLQQKTSENSPECYEGMTDFLLTISCIFLAISFCLGSFYPTSVVM